MEQIEVKVKNHRKTKTKETQESEQELPKNSSENTMDESKMEGSAVFSVKSSRKRQRQKSNRQVVKSRIQSSSATISLNNKRSIKSTAKHSEKKIMLNTVRNTNLVDSTMPRKKIFRRRIPTYPERRNSFLEKSYYTDNLVELYHNKAVKHGSDSDVSNPGDVYADNESRIMNASVQPKRKNVPHHQFQQNKPQPSIPPLKIGDGSDQYHQYSIDNSIKNNSELSPIQENDYLEPEAERNDYCFTKNYELPTIASKMKQVPKSYLRTFDFRAIPFCPAKSTSPSHNIGINIQQVMSIIKTRQPVTGISPTLAHNIGLAAEKLNNRPLSALVSSLGSRMG